MPSQCGVEPVGVLCSPTAKCVRHDSISFSAILCNLSITVSPRQSPSCCIISPQLLLGLSQKVQQINTLSCLTLSGCNLGVSAPILHCLVACSKSGCHKYARNSTQVSLPKIPPLPLNVVECSCSDKVSS